jgi:hypothetical protein
LLAIKSITQPPKLGAVRLNQKIKSATVGKLDKLLARLGVANGGVGERHGISGSLLVAGIGRRCQTRYQQKYQQNARLPAIIAEQM